MIDAVCIVVGFATTATKYNVRVIVTAGMDNSDFTLVVNAKKAVWCRD